MNNKPKGWLDLLLNRQIKRADPDRSRDHLAQHPLTYDRRRAAADLAQAEAAASLAAGKEAAPGIEAKVQPGLIYRNNQHASASEMLRESIQGSADQVEVEQDEITEADEEAAGAKSGKRQCPRRASKRVLAPTEFHYFLTPDSFVRMELTVLLFEDKRPRAVDCYLCDVSDLGIGFACPEQLQVGDAISVCAHLSDDVDPLVDAMVEIRNVRPMPPERERPEKFAGKPLWIHGALLEPESAQIMLKATLDCIALQVATGGGPDI